ncbi:hypothetical protein AK830_g10786 [Neonectria ditissima]|uniref:F-box domain-containing protein n=1 Tax=Neonectria ditissima TaxID=78410 RepID=A0A0N8H5C7_9HYPO|nr:hypothetical protein AK830_g10786 [Neonectria ditissima]
MTPSPPISRLPIELHHLIIDTLAFPDTAHLRATCRFLAALIPAQSSHYADLIAAEDSVWAVSRCRLTCVYCARMRRASAFTEKQKAEKPEYRSCYECQLKDLDSFDRQPTRWSWRAPKNHHRTRLTDEPRKLKVDHVETEFCQWCHNVFKRWGRENAGRGVCSGCFHDNGFELGIWENHRLRNDMKRMKTNVVPSLAGHDVEEWDDLLDAVYYEWWRYYEWIEPPFVIPGEIRSMWKRHSRLGNYWVMGGYTQQHRWHSCTLALQIKAALEGLTTGVYGQCYGN